MRAVEYRLRKGADFGSGDYGQGLAVYKPFTRMIGILGTEWFRSRG